MREERKRHRRPRLPEQAKFNVTAASDPSSPGLHHLLSLAWIQPPRSPMKHLILIVAVVALSWFGFTRYLAPPHAATENRISPGPRVPPAEFVQPAKPAAPSPAAIPPPATLQPVQVARASTAAPDPKAPIQIDLAQALGPDNNYQDTLVGLSVLLPEGWSIRNAIRWGPDHRQNTVFLKPELASSASPSMYYKHYTPEEAASIRGTGAEALLREQAQKKEASRLAGVPDYLNVPDSFSFFDVHGSPALSYFATFTRGGQVMTEHFIRVLGPKGYVMFFTTGKFEDVKAIMPQLRQAASTVRGP